MDNQATEPSTADLNIDSAALEFGNLFADPVEPVKKEPAAEANVDVEAADNKEADDANPEVTEQPEGTEDDGITIEVDGKEVKLSKEELAEAYKNGLRQADYTKKTMEVAEQRKAAEAEIQKAQQERRAHAEGLQKISAQLEGTLSEFQSIDWQSLLQSDPIEYMQKRHLFEQRQAQYYKVQQDRQMLNQIEQQEQQKYIKSLIATEQQELLAKLPDWKDAKKAEAESTAIRSYLIQQGFDQNTVDGLADHKAIVLGRKAMLYDAMMAKASAATNKVASLPQKVLKPGGGEKPDQNSTHKKDLERLGRTGRVEDAATLFKSFV